MISYVVPVLATSRAKARVYNWLIYHRLCCVLHADSHVPHEAHGLSYGAFVVLYRDRVL